MQNGRRRLDGSPFVNLSLPPFDKGGEMKRSFEDKGITQQELLDGEAFAHIAHCSKRFPCKCREDVL